ncbi:MAG: tRNA (adenosine(37)-N6)-dimethylallyltransferase MiaA [Chloroflexota bacterium]|nr:tRNA (adenosine(37)-N6)-dimethylallyltransferase MiaA [Chloroflexota bacterium]
MNRAEEASPLIGIVGPTGSGKTELSLALARSWPVEILVADSRQVYRGMDIGTAKPDAGARATVPHHLLDLIDPGGEFSVAQWLERARVLIPEIAARGMIPMLVGGTGLYVTALLDGHDYASQSSGPELRMLLADELASGGPASLAARLTAIDPATAERTDLRNPRRVVRALERAAAGSGRPSARAYGGRMALIGISRPRDVLYRRIDDRAVALFSGGLLDEVRALLDAGISANTRPMTSHGYPEAARYLAGEWSLDQAVEVTARRTRQYAKRQLTWFRPDRRIVWVAAGDEPADSPTVVAQAESVLRGLLG